MSDETQRKVIEETIGQSVALTEWRTRMKEGVIVDLKIKFWKARKKLTLEELGIDPPTQEIRDAYEELLKVGSKLLLPEATIRELASLERAARYHLETYAYKTPFGYFLPYSTYALWKEKNEECKRQFFAKRDEIILGKDEYGNREDRNGQPIPRYNERVSTLLQQYEQIARHTYQLMKSQDATNLSSFLNEDDYVQHFCNEVIYRHIKPADKFYESFVYQETLSRMPLLSDLETEETSDSEITELMTTRQAEQQAARERARMLEVMNRDLVQKAREQKEALLDTFVTSLLTQLRSTTYDAVTSVLASIKQQETLQGRPAIQLKHLIDELNTLNFYGDGDIDTILTTLHGIIEKPAKERNIAEIQRQLRSIATLTRGTILALGESPREGKDTTMPTEIGISDTPSDEEIREARQELTSAYSGTMLFSTALREEREERQEVIPTSLAQEEQRRERSE